MQIIQVDQITYFLFCRFPREVSFYRKKVNNIDEFIHYIIMSNGVNDVVTSVYDSHFIIDKVWFDIDAPSVEKALGNARQFVKFLNRNNIPFIPVFSGRKGFHFYAIFKRWKPSNIDTAKFVLNEIHTKFSKSAGGLEYMDTQHFGDVRAMTRVPNTKRPSLGTYCTYLPYDFVNWSALKIVKWSQQQHHIAYNFIGSSLPDIRDFVNLNTMKSKSYNSREEDVSLSFNGLWNGLNHQIPDDIITFLKGIVRPCVVEALEPNGDCPHNIRTDLVSELMYLGYSEKQILEIIRRLNWSDFNENITRYHIKRIFRKRIKPLSCSKLKLYVNCKKCDCFYWW